MSSLLRSASFRRLIRSLVFFFVIASLMMLTMNVLDNFQSSSQVESQLVFEGFNNETGADHFIVPNIIHLIRFNKTKLTFSDYICIQAAYRNHRPDYFYIHTDIPNGQFRGKYWKLITNDLELKSRIRILPQEAPTEIFGQKLNPEWRFWHGGDVARIRTMMKYGGIYLDNDVYVINNLDKYRKYEIAMNWDENQFLASQVIIANKDARFLRLWLESYRKYRPKEWYYNAGERPTKKILIHHPELIHRVKVQFGADLNLSYKLYVDPEFDWRNLDAIHLMINHRNYMDPYYNETPYFNAKIVEKYEFPFGEMAREMIEASGMKHWL